MRVKMKVWMGVLALGVATVVVAADKKKAAAPAPAAQMDPAMMQAMKYGTPGEAHKMLQPFVGHWNATVRSWMKPGDKVQESQGTSDNDWVLGARYLKEKFVGTWGGQAFNGLGYVGYDNVRGEYQSVWMDNMATGMMQASGSYDAASKTLKIGGNFSCPMTGEKEKWFRSEWAVIDNDNNVYTSYFKDTDGKEFKRMEIVYKRTK